MLWPRLKFSLRTTTRTTTTIKIWPWRRSQVTVKVTTWYHRKGLVTRNTHAKYQSSICNSAKVMAKVKVFVTDGQTEGRTDGRMRFNVPTLSRKRGTTTTLGLWQYCKTLIFRVTLFFASSWHWIYSRDFIFAIIHFLYNVL